jgi:hypothetical protein
MVMFSGMDWESLSTQAPLDPHGIESVAHQQEAILPSGGTSDSIDVIRIRGPTSKSIAAIL